MAESNSKRSLPAGIAGSIKNALEIVSLVMMILVCGAISMAIWRGGWGVPSSAAVAATSRRPQRPPEPKLPTIPVSLDGAKLRG
jgi:hypothetical protein